jgi:hypothetical protein
VRAKSPISSSHVSLRILKMTSLVAVLNYVKNAKVTLEYESDEMINSCLNLILGVTSLFLYCKQRIGMSTI